MPSQPPLLILATTRGESHADASICLIAIDETFQRDQHSAQALFAHPVYKDTLAKVTLHGDRYVAFGAFTSILDALSEEQASDLDQEGYAAVTESALAIDLWGKLREAHRSLGLARMDYVQLNFYPYGFAISGCEKYFCDEIETPLIDFTTLHALAEVFAARGEPAL